ELSALALEFDGGRLDRRVGGGFASSAASKQTAPATRDAAARASARGLDWFTFFLADIQTGFGPFVAIYLTAQAWTQFDIGLILTTGGLVALACQMPGGALVDAMRSARLVAVLAVAAICLSALALAIWPTFLVVMAAPGRPAGVGSAPPPAPQRAGSSPVWPCGARAAPQAPFSLPAVPPPPRGGGARRYFWSPLGLFSPPPGGGGPPPYWRSPASAWA